MLLCRTISAKLGESKIHIYDTVENQGFTQTPFMLLYHMNFGYPLVDEGTVLETNLPAPRPRDADAEAGLETYKTFEAPQPGYREQVFYHKSEKTSYASLYNKNINLEACVRYDGGELPYLMVWKQMGRGRICRGHGAGHLVCGRQKRCPCPG